MHKEANNGADFIVNRDRCFAGFESRTVFFGEAGSIKVITLNPRCLQSVK